MKRHPDHHRRSIRLPGYDYAQPGAYFVTICTCQKECLLGDAVDGTVALSEYGQIVESCWLALPGHFVVELDAFVVMPNHIHGIIVIGDGRGEAFPARSAGNASPLRGPHGRRPGSLAAIIQNFKSVSTRRVNQARATPGLPFWQRNYYEHVVRDEDDLRRIRQYIADNPARWEMDEENPHRLR